MSIGDRLYARAIHDYSNPELDSQFSFKKGDKIILYQCDPEETWWEGAVETDPPSEAPVTGMCLWFVYWS